MESQTPILARVPWDELEDRARNEDGWMSDRIQPCRGFSVFAREGQTTFTLTLVEAWLLGSMRESTPLSSVADARLPSTLAGSSILQ